MNEHITPQRTTVTLNGILDKVKGATYTLLPNGRTTICQLTMENGFTIEGQSACVDAANYNKALGEKYAYEDAINNVWKFEGYLLAEEIFRRGPAKKLYSWADVATHAQMVDQMTGDTQFKVVMRDGAEFRGVVEFDNSEKAGWTEQRMIKEINRQVAEGARP